MQTEMPFFEGPEDALREAVRGLGGPKKVGPLLWPDKTHDAAARLLQDCLNVSREEKLALSQMMFVLRAARDAGVHAPFQYIAGELGYDAKPITREEETDRLASVIEHSTATLASALAHLGRLQAMPVKRAA